MTTTSTPRLALPLLEPGQAQKEMFHNEALMRIDIATQTSVLSADANVPPDEPAPGACWLIGTAPTGAWAGKAGFLAGWTSGGWHFVAPRDGMRIWIEDMGTHGQFVAGEWHQNITYGKVFVQGRQVVGEIRPAIAEPNGGVTVDQEARGSISAVLEALRAHGLIETG